jgi:hypothetical protein
MNADETIFLKKITGKTEPFNRKKLRDSLFCAGLEANQTDSIIEEVMPKIECGMSTTRVHNMAFKVIRKESKVMAANYRVKRSILELGPTGFPFETLCSELFKAKGFKTDVSLDVEGSLVKHEVDIYAEREDLKLMVECKFHNSREKKNDIKTVLYINSRAEDIRRNPNAPKFDKYAICTNTHFSKDALRYAEGMGIELISLNKDPKYSMVDAIIEHKVYPITCLKTIKKKTVGPLLKRNIVVISHLEKNLSVMKDYDYTDEEIGKISNEIRTLDKAINE